MKKNISIPINTEDHKRDLLDPIEQLMAETGWGLAKASRTLLYYGIAAVKEAKLKGTFRIESKA